MQKPKSLEIIEGLDDLDKLYNPETLLPVLEQIEKEKQEELDRVQPQLPKPYNPCATCDSLAEGGGYDCCRDCEFNPER